MDHGLGFALGFGGDGIFTGDGFECPEPASGLAWEFAEEEGDGGFTEADDLLIGGMEDDLMGGGEVAGFGLALVDELVEDGFDVGGAGGGLELLEEGGDFGPEGFWGGVDGLDEGFFGGHGGVDIVLSSDNQF